MQTATAIAQTIVRLTGAVQVVLGVLFWVGSARGMIPVHMLLGLVLVLALWVLTGLAARAGVDPALVAVAGLWGFLTPALGLTQTSLLPGDYHWLIQVLHLFVGLAAIGLGDVLATRITAPRRAARPA